VHRDTMSQIASRKSRALYRCFGAWRKSLLSQSRATILEADWTPAAPFALSRSLSYSSMASTTTTARPCFSTVTGSARAKSMRRQKPYLASFADMFCMSRPPNRHDFWPFWPNYQGWMMKKTLVVERVSGDAQDRGRLASLASRPWHMLNSQPAT
jgi:hypothetical protein